MIARCTLINYLKEFGTVLTEHVGWENAVNPPSDIPTGGLQKLIALILICSL